MEVYSVTCVTGLRGICNADRTGTAYREWSRDTKRVLGRVQAVVSQRWSMR